MDVEPIANISSNGTFDPDESYRSERQNVLDVPILLAASAGIVADLIIIFNILRNKELRIRSNIYIVNLCICNVFYLFFTPIILNLFSAAEKIHLSTICFSDELFFLFMLGNYIFVCILLSDWYIVTYKSLNASVRCRASYKLIISTVWAVLFVLSLTILLQCTAGVSRFYFIALLAILFYFGSFIFVGVICVFKVVNEKTTSVVETKPNNELVYVMSYFLCWLPNWMFIFASVFQLFARSTIVGLSTFMIGYIHSVILLYLMYVKDEKFKVALRKWIFNEEIKTADEETYANDEHFTTLL